MTDPWTSRLTVDLDAVAANYRALKQAAGGAEVAPVVKADAYGLGAGVVGRRLWREGAARFFVARISEGEALRRRLGAARPAQIYVLDGCPPGADGRLETADLTPVLSSLEQVGLWAARQGRSRAAALHVDTGMNRLGVTPEEAEAIAKGRAGRPLRIDMVLSHLACAADPEHPMNQAQAETFTAVRALWPDALASLANTDGVFLGPTFRHDVVRPGIGLYGGGPFEQAHAAFKTAARLEAPILQVRHVNRDGTVGYGATWRADRATTVAIIAAGFADGVLRALGPGGYGWLDGQVRPFLGRLSMDLIALDVTDCPAAVPGAMVELLGPNVGLNAVAKRAATTPYDVLARLAPRRARVAAGRP